MTYIKSVVFICVFHLCCAFSANVWAESFAVEHVAYNAGKLNKLSKNGEYLLSEGSEQFGIYKLIDGKYRRDAGVCCFRGKSVSAEFVGASTQKIITVDQSESEFALEFWDLKGLPKTHLNLGAVDKFSQFSIEENGRFLYFLNKDMLTVVSLDREKILKKVKLIDSSGYLSVWGGGQKYIALVMPHGMVKIVDLATGTVQSVVSSNTDVSWVKFLTGEKQEILFPYRDGSIALYDINEMKISKIYLDEAKLNVKDVFIDNAKRIFYKVSTYGVSAFDIDMGNKVAFIHATDVLKEGSKIEELNVRLNYAVFNSVSKVIFLFDSQNSVNKVYLKNNNEVPVGRGAYLASSMCAKKDVTVIDLIKNIPYESWMPDEKNKSFCASILNELTNGKDFKNLPYEACGGNGDWSFLATLPELKKCSMPFPVLKNGHQYWSMQIGKAYSVETLDGNYSVIFQQHLFQPSSVEENWVELNGRYFYNFSSDVYTVLRDSDCRVVNNIFVTPNKDYLTQRFNASTSSLAQVLEKKIILDVASLNDAEFVSSQGWTQTPKLKLSVFDIQSSINLVTEPACRWAY